MKKPLLLVLGIFILGVVAYFATQNAVLRNLIHVLKYERTLDRYSQADTTATDVDNRTDRSGRQAGLLSAFFGVDDGLPSLASRVICDGADGKDGMPVIFSHEVDVNTIEPGDFEVTRASGKTGEITCLTMAPADDPGELRTALLVGQYGSADDQPVTVEIVGNILSLDQAVNFKGSSVAVIPLEDGPSMVWVEVVPEAEWSLGHPGTPPPWGGGTGCPVDTKQIVRVTWSGGITKPDGSDADDFERQMYKVTVEQEGSIEAEITPFALGDLSDGDNNHKLCLDTGQPATFVSFPAGYLTDPRDDLNPATSIAITR
jgi:hypothetical protein